MAKSGDPTSPQRVESSKSKSQSPEPPPGPSETETRRPLKSAFAALKQARLFRFRKKGGGGKGWAAGLINLFDDYLEVEADHQLARTYLGDEAQEENLFRRARREALLLQHLESLGGHPTHLARYLNSLLGVNRDRDFKHFIADQIRPRLDSLARRIEALPADERRLVAALVARASYQVGVRSAENFGRLLASAGTAEAADWAKSSEKAPVRAEQLAHALRRAANPRYRSALIEAGRDSLKRLAADTVGLPLEEMHLTWGWLLRAAECLEFDTLPALAEPLLAGVIGKGSSVAVGTLAGVLGPTLRIAPGGGSLVVQFIVTLTERGEVKAAGHLVEMLREVFHQARGSCLRLLAALRECDAVPSGGAGRDSLLAQLEDHCALLISLIPTCSRVLEKGQGLPTGSTAVLTEALLSMATLGVAGATPSGQRLLRKALLAQERGRETFLSTLPRVALTLAQPKLGPILAEAGLNPAHFQYGGRPFLERVALNTGRAVVGPLLARQRKGDDATAKVLLRSMIRNNAALFGLTPDGAYLAAEALEAQRDKPDSVPLKKTLYRLSKIRKKNALGQHPNSIEPFQDLVTALASGQPPPEPTRRPRTSTRLTMLEFAVDRAVHTKKKPSPTLVDVHLDLLELPPR